MATGNTFPEKKLDEFVAKLKAAAGDNLVSVVLYGSAVTGEYDPEFSNINLLCFVRESSFAKLKEISPAVQWWFKEGNRAPMPTKREAIKQLAGSLRFDATPFENLLDVREHRANRSQFQVQDVAARYLSAVEQVTSAVDRMLDSPQGS
jgi:hypothetical protein